MIIVIHKCFMRWLLYSDVHVMVIFGKCIYVTRSNEMRNKSGHIKSGKLTSKSVGDDFALKC